MQNGLHDRMEQPNRKRGRPKKGDQRTEYQEVVDVVIPDRVPGMVCPKCGRGMVPRIERHAHTAEKGRTVYCMCTMCGCRFEYRPPMTRIT
jgi:DNA-directed RNA polymerase subunit M/transcription elongation factor TFIIS